MKSKFWESKEGKIEISKMEDNHLMNAINLIRKKAKEGITICGGQYYEEGEEDFFEYTVTGKEVFGYFDGYYDLVKEAKNRHLL